MKLSIVTAVCGKNDVTNEFITTTLGNCAEPHELIIISNGSSKDELQELIGFKSFLENRWWKVKLVSYDDPLGTTRAFEAGAFIADNDIIVMLHNDLMILEDGWDHYVENFFTESKNNGMRVGVCGFVGGKRLGSPDIYSSPYQLTQMARFDVFSSQDDAELHGTLTSEIVEVAVLDGMALIVEKEVYERIGGLDIKYVHHMYDNDLCVAAHYTGFKNYVLPIKVHHQGGMTSCGVEYGEWAKENHGSDELIHRRSHEYFYDKWMDMLPVEIS